MTSFALSSGFNAFINVAIVIWSIVSMWIVFKKAGRKGWESIIPVWNVYVLFKIIGKTGRFWITLLGLPLIGIIWLIVSLVFYLLGQGGEGISTIKNLINRLLGLASFVFMIITIILTIMARCRLAKKFGKSGGFAVGLIFLTPIFLGILAFSDAKYEGVEFNEKYSWKKWLLITLGIALVIGGCKAGWDYKQYQAFYNYFLSEYEFKNGENNGEFNGTTLSGKEYGGRYENGKKVGHWIEYDYERKWEGDYNEEGERDGERVIITEDGKLGGGRYENGEKIGHWIEYVASIKLEGNYSDKGLKGGERKSYYDNGDLFEIGTYKDGKQEGEWTYYRKNGTSTTLLFKEGKPWNGTKIESRGEESEYVDGSKLMHLKVI